MLKCIFYICFIIITLMLGLAPWVVGEYFKKNYLHIVELLNEDSRIKVAVIDYQQGWFTSKAKLRVSIVDTSALAPSSPLPPINFMLDQQIDHGPFVYNALQKQAGFGYANIYSNMHSPEQISRSILTTYKNAGLVELSALAKFNGEWVGKIRMPKLSLAVPPLARFNWDGFDGTFKVNFISDRIRNFTVNFRIGTLIMDVDLANNFVKRIKVLPTIYNNDTARNGHGLWSSNSSFNTSGVVLTQPDNTLITADNSSLYSTFGIASNTIYSALIILNMENVQLNNSEMPNLPLLHFDISANNFDTEGLFEYIRYLKTATVEQVKKTDLTTLQALLSHAILKTSILRANMKVDSSWGNLSLYSKSTWKPDASRPSSFAEINANSLTRIKVQASQVITEKIVTEFKARFTEVKDDATKIYMPAETTPLTIATTLNDLQKIGYIGKVNDLYTTELTIVDGVLKINGRELKPKVSQPNIVQKAN